MTKPKLQVRQVFLSERDTMRAATVTAAPALAILVALFSCLAVVGVKNASASCSLPLAPFLVAFGSVGLTFTAVHLHYTAYYAGCAEAPRRPTFVLGLVSFSALCLAAVALLALTYAASDECQSSAPVLYRWSFSASVYFLVLLSLLGLVPCCRLVGTCVCAPAALCVLGCVRALQVELPMDELLPPEADALMADTHERIEDAGRRDELKEEPLLCGCLAPEEFECGDVVCRPFAFVGGCAKLLCSIALLPCALLAYCRHRCCLDLPAWELDGPCPACPAACPGCEVKPCSVRAPARPCADPSPLLPHLPSCRLRLTPPPRRSARSQLRGLLTCCAHCFVSTGCAAPGRSVLALFVNTAFLLWSFLCLLLEVHASWTLECDASSDFAVYPSPLHVLVVLFALVGFVTVLAVFIYDVFAPPSPPPRSEHEAAWWRGCRQTRVGAYGLLLVCFLLFGCVLLWFVVHSTSCAALAPSVYRAACLVLVVWFGMLIVAVAVAALFCVDCCCCSARLRITIDVLEEGRA